MKSEMNMIDPRNKAQAPLVGAVIVTHGHLANELLATAEMVVGPIAQITTASIDWHDDIDVARDALERAIARVSQGRGVLLLTDMFGGAPTDVASMFLDDANIEVVSGVNLPMIIALTRQAPEKSLSEVARAVRDSGKEGIHLAGELLSTPAKTSRA
jgi:mannose PTS system EIIA component